MNKKIVVVDICYTLFKSNTTFDFFKYCANTAKFSITKKVFLKILLSKSSPVYWTVAVIEKLIKKDLFKYFTVKLLAGKYVNDVDTWAEKFYFDFLKSREIDITMRIVKDFDAFEVILISATLTPIAKAIAKNMEIETFLSTQLEVINGRYTGKIIGELSGKKLEALYAFKKEKVLIDVMMTDNLTDRQIMEAADCKYAVCHNKEQEKFWSSLPKINILNV